MLVNKITSCELMSKSIFIKPETAEDGGLYGAWMADSDLIYKYGAEHLWHLEMKTFLSVWPLPATPRLPTKAQLAQASMAKMQYSSSILLMLVTMGTGHNKPFILCILHYLLARGLTTNYEVFLVEKSDISNQHDHRFRCQTCLPTWLKKRSSTNRDQSYQHMVWFLNM